jgi:leader peptidase (prepilin peptidase)/N-methyltransferase
MDFSLYLLLFIVGTILGSFINVVIYRLPKNISLFYPHSSCIKCESRLNWYENVPLISYLVLKGKCKNCGELISLSYPLIELFTGMFMVILYFYSQNILHLSYLTFLMMMFISMSIIDYKHFILPDKLLIAAAIVSIIYSIISNGLLVFDNLLSAAIIFFILFLLRIGSKKLFKKESFGIGDIKLGTLIGFLLGWQQALIAIFFGFCIAAFTIAIFYALKGIKKNMYIPFGPFMIGGMIVYIIWGKQIIQWYISYASGQ